jgi:hypothetical protein
VYLVIKYFSQRPGETVQSPYCGRLVLGRERPKKSVNLWGKKSFFSTIKFYLPLKEMGINVTMYPPNNDNNF